MRIRVLIVILATLALMGCNKKNVMGGKKSVYGYVLAFATPPNGAIKVRYCKEDVQNSWRNGGSIGGGDFRLNAPGGISVASDGVAGTWIGDDRNNEIEMWPGIGAGFDIEDPTGPITDGFSLPSMVSLGKARNWLVCFLGKGSVVSVRRYYNSVRKEALEPIDRDGILRWHNDDVVGRPAIAYVKENNRVILVWNRGGWGSGNMPTFRFATGEYSWDTNRITWEESGELPPLNIGRLDFGISLDHPTLAVSGESVFCGVLRNTGTGRPETQKGRYTIYRTTDGNDWIEFKRFDLPFAGGYGELAALPNGHMLLVIIQQALPGTRLSIRRYDGSSWTLLSSTPVLGTGNTANGSPMGLARIMTLED